MAITILTSIQDNFGYYNNLGFLRRGLLRQEGEEGRIQFQDVVNNLTPAAIDFGDKRRVYDFIRSAGSRIREDMTTYLGDVLPGVTDPDRQLIREALDCLFNYHTYRDHLEQVGDEQRESMHMLIFNDANGDENQQYVAHVHFSGVSRKTAARQYTVNVSLTCQRFTYFPLQETNIQAVHDALQNLHL